MGKIWRNRKFWNCRRILDFLQRLALKCFTGLAYWVSLLSRTLSFLLYLIHSLWCWRLLVCLWVFVCFSWGKLNRDPGSHFGRSDRNVPFHLTKLFSPALLFYVLLTSIITKSAVAWVGSVQPEYTVPLGAWNFRNFKPEFLLNGKSPGCHSNFPFNYAKKNHWTLFVENFSDINRIVLVVECMLPCIPTQKHINSCSFNVMYSHFWKPFVLAVHAKTMDLRLIRDRNYYKTTTKLLRKTLIYLRNRLHGLTQRLQNPRHYFKNFLLTAIYVF